MLLKPLQMLGRGLRPKGGRKALVLDHAENCLRLGGAKAERNWTLQGLVEEMPEPAMEAFIEQPISKIPQTPIDLPKRHVEIYETDINFYNIPTNAELETHLAQQTYRQPVLPRDPSTRSPINSNQTTPSRDRSSTQTRKVTAKPSPKVSSTRRSSRPNRQLSPL